MIYRTLFIALVVLLASCTQDQIINAVSNDKNSCTVDGSGYTAASFKGYDLDTASRAQMSDTTAIVGFSGFTNTTGEVFVIGITCGSTMPGTYTVNALGGTTISLVTRASGGTPRTFTATSGTVSISEWGAVGGVVKGTFSGSLVLPTDVTTPVLQITNGKFDVKRAS